MAELPIPVGFRAETVQQVTRLLRSGESCAVVGVGSSGKSNVARHLARADVRQEYFGPEADSTLLVYVNCKPLARRAAHELFLHALDQMGRALAEQTGALRQEQAAVEALWQAAEAQPESLARRNLDLAVSKLEQAGSTHIGLVLDDCDDLFALAAPVLFSDLRGLRDNHKPRLVYATFTRREPAFLREATREFEELFELLSAPGHTIPVGPYLEADALLMLRRLAARQSPARSLTEAEAQRLYQLAGGHAGLLRALFFATQFDPALAADALAPLAWTHLVDHADVEGECGKIWDSLEPEERADLALAAQGQAPSSDGARRLERRGLLRRHLNGGYEVFSPIFERVLPRLAGARAMEAGGKREQGAGGQGAGEKDADVQDIGAGAAIEFVGLGRQVRVNGALVTLLAPEFEILRCLEAARPEPCSRLKLIEAMRLAEQSERSEKIAGDPLRRLHGYMRQLKARLGPAGGLIQHSGDGYRLAPEERPA